MAGITSLVGKGVGCGKVFVPVCKIPPSSAAVVAALLKVVSELYLSVSVDDGEVPVVLWLQ